MSNLKDYDFIVGFTLFPPTYKTYVKCPECLKQTKCEVDLKIDYKTEEFTFLI